jgi:hypothetical protein
MIENLYRAAARIKLLKKIKVSFCYKRPTPLFSKGRNAINIRIVDEITLINHEDLLNRIQDKGN